MLPQQYCLRWKYHHSNLQTMFSQLLDRGCFCDVTLACEGQLIRAHRVVLCACSTFFDTVLTNYASERDPIIIMKDVTFADIKCLIEFMYKGEINVEHANLASLLKTADDLKIKGLAEVTWRDDEDGPPPPTPQTEFHSPTLSRNRDSHSYDHYGHESQRRSHSPGSEREQKTPSPKAITTRLPTLTPIPTSAVSIVTAAGSPIDSYLGPKRKRGRPPLDDAYDVFNVRKLGAHYSDHGDSAYNEGSQYNDELNHHLHHATSQHSRPNSPSAASTVYQQHIQLQKQRLRYRPLRQPDDHNDDESATEPEWITSSLEHENDPKDPLDNVEAEEGEIEEPEDIKILPGDSEECVAKRSAEKRSNESTPEHPKMKRKSSKEENTTTEKSENDEVELETEDSAATVPQTVEEIETVQHSKEKTTVSSTNSTSTTTNSSTSSATCSSSASSPLTSAAHKSSSSSSSTTTHSHHQQHHHHHHHPHHSQHSHHPPPPPPPPLHHPHHYGKYVPDGYLINEHGILMTHDFIHAPTATIPTSSSSASNGHHPDDYVDIKMEEFTEAELRLTTEEMSQWQDVIKMDDYLAKGRRPQFWEEPFTRRVLDAIKNKRLEMKKAARILGVSYGTLYGRYREVYGCLKHPYSSSSLRPSQSSALAVQPRFDIVWPSPKPGQMDIGKIRPKDLSELWTRPQI